MLWRRLRRHVLQELSVSHCCQLQEVGLLRPWHG